MPQYTDKETATEFLRLIKEHEASWVEGDEPHYALGHLAQHVRNNMEAHQSGFAEMLKRFVGVYAADCEYVCNKIVEEVV